MAILPFLCEASGRDMLALAPVSEDEIQLVGSEVLTARGITLRAGRTAVPEDVPMAIVDAVEPTSGLLGDGGATVGAGPRDETQVALERETEAEAPASRRALRPAVAIRRERGALAGERSLACPVKVVRRESGAVATVTWAPVESGMERTATAAADAAGGAACPHRSC